MIDFFSRLDKFMKHKGLNDNKITIQAGISNGLIGKARKRGSLSQENISKILYTYEDLNANWLFTGLGKMLNQEFDSEGKALDKFRLETDTDIIIQDVPLYNIEAAAGLVQLFQTHGDIKPIGILRIPNLPKCDGAVFVTGDSMYPSLKSGDIVAYKQLFDIKTEIFWGEMYLISVEVAGEEFISVKYLQKSDKGDRYIKLVSKNPQHQPKDVDLQKVRAVALIKATVRIHSM